MRDKSDEGQAMESLGTEARGKIGGEGKSGK